MAHITQPLPAAENSQKPGSTHTFALTSLTTLFFMWGFLTCLNDILIPYLKGMFSLNYTQAMLVQFCFFGAYFVMSIPAGKLVSKIGYQFGIVVGLVVASIGCALFYPAAEAHVYELFLLALFVLASGITILQVSANPYVSVLGPAKTASSRLTMTQAFNSLGTTVAPLFGSWLILSEISQATAEQVKFPYLMLSASLLTLAIIFAFLKLPKLGKAIDSEAENQGDTEFVDLGSVWKYRHLILGAIGIFVYVGAEVAIGSFLVGFLTLDHIAGLPEQQAAHYISYYFAGAMIGRFAGAAIMQRLNAAKVLACHGILAGVLVLIAMTGQGSLAMWAILLVGLCNSIMFPTIFSLALQGLGKYTSQGSGILCLAIVGGAIIPLLQGMLADNIGVQLALILPIGCYLYITYFALFGAKKTTSTRL
ncbi:MULTISPECIES: sugar MFS transporter [Pseudoalteromonas]|jgi:FHS family L-fucose permease-like MFS transporter|uniref:sugar MFS transporter n=2 Tax=Pseudoalteromonas TaxID=53246 RepID=UPI00051A58B2|nr:MULTISPECIES: sugar MFS transporter [Pseudoalteromonas]KGK02938.1 glucose/galactose transporter [Pseudoalteromonas sp. ND6B]MDN3404037.1 sugar MFS transporter [Pseudoalteromonas sp. APC 3218]MDN3407937.1 sugar MFS transporter [Pseudoalteromonas sp. APC 3894]MDN3415577.1 sugar MFS transporter [Pseudoalteromonas sp. APC 3227]MDN3419275.1 sugar MFS transporter [Pseudoalteromonas sp. APC 3895]|tara:strand:+ start:24709 stop:25974 length:1266 start_codon:yes stop_codon:yes gene_type:complete